MTYNVFIGFLSNLNLSWQNWLFCILFLEIIFIAFSSYISLNKSYFKKYDNTNKAKIISLTISSISILILVGIIGFFTFIITYFIVISFISDYRLNEKA
jgi:hypothetical protein